MRPKVSMKALTEPEQTSSDSDVSIADHPNKSVSGTINNNQDVLKALALICDYYKKNEPSSPVPLFLERGFPLSGQKFHGSA